MELAKNLLTYAELGLAAVSATGLVPLLFQALRLLGVHVDAKTQARLSGLFQRAIASAETAIEHGETRPLLELAEGYIRRLNPGDVKKFERIGVNWVAERLKAELAAHPTLQSVAAAALSDPAWDLLKELADQLAELRADIKGLAAPVSDAAAAPLQAAADPAAIAAPLPVIGEAAQESGPGIGDLIHAVQEMHGSIRSLADGLLQPKPAAAAPAAIVP